MKKYKLIIILLSLCMITISCITKIKHNANNSFKLEASLTNVPDSTLFYLKNVSKNITLDSAYVINGTLSLKGQMAQHNYPENLTLLSISPEFLYLMLLVKNDDHITFNAEKNDFPWNIDVSGSAYHDSEEKFHQINYYKQVLKEKLNRIYGSNRDILEKKIAMVEDSISNVEVSLIKKEINSYAALKYFKYHKTKFSREELKTMYNKLDDDLKETPTGKSIKLQSQFSKPEVGDMYYDYSALNQDGNTLALSQIKDKYILLHFSALGCPYNKASIPKLREAYDSHRNKLEIISISLDTNREQWENHIKRDSISWPYLWDGKGDFNDANIKYWKTGTPNYVLIAPNKKIVENWYGYREGLIKEKLEKYFD